MRQRGVWGALRLVRCELEAQLRGLDRDVPPVPVMALTARAMSADRDRCLSAGMNDYIAKPIDAARLAEVIGKYSL